MSRSFKEVWTIMKKSMAFKAIKNTLLSIVVLLPLQLNVGITGSPNEYDANERILVKEDEVPPSAKPRVVLLDIDGIYCDTECFLKKNKETVEFLGETFGIDSKYIYEDLIRINGNAPYDEYNIGKIKNKNGLMKYDSFEEGLIEYLFTFAANNKELVSNERTPYKGNSEYVIELIKYFTGIYKNVDFLTAVSIGAAESGHYKATYMMNCNNIYGGMSKNGLIKYKNIEYGTLSFVRLLSKNYFGQGLTTLESIGRVYCPTFVNGTKVASSHWLNLVKSMKKIYASREETTTIEVLKTLK